MKTKLIFGSITSKSSRRVCRLCSAKVAKITKTIFEAISESKKISNKK
jgi:hypothetical protein